MLLEDCLIRASSLPNVAWTFVRDLVGDAVPLLSQPALPLITRERFRVRV